MSSANPFNVAYLPYMGQDAPNPRNTFYRRRAPTNSDRRLYKVGDRWIDTAAQIVYMLVGKTATTANWVQLSGAGGVTSLNGETGALTLINQGGAGAITVTAPGSGGPNTIGFSVNVDGVTIQIVGNQLVAVGGVSTFNGNVGSASPVAGVLNVIGGAGSGITVTGAGNTLTFTFTNGLPASTFTVNAAVAPGVNPVTPTALGNVSVLGAAVAAAGVPVQTVSRALNTYTLEVQRAIAIGASAANNAGLASFNSAMFSVDANGYVSLAGGGIAFDEITVDASTPPGTNPVVPTASGGLTLTGAQAAAGTIPTSIRTDSLLANTITIEIQRASAQPVSSVSQNGVSHFNSAQFSVDPFGFVSLIGGGFTWQDFAGGALAVSNGYFATAAAVYTLPLGTIDGQTVEIIDNIGGGVVVTASGAQTVRIQNTNSTAGGTATSTQFGDALRLIFRLSIGEWQCCPGGGGIWLLA